MRVQAGGTTLAVVDAHEDPQTQVEQLLDECGAVMIRGAGVTDAAAFQHRVAGFGAPLIDSYKGGNTPRSAVTDTVFTSTEYPAEYEISLHNELSYAHAWPQRLYFACLIAARDGGATPVCDGRALLGDLPDDVRTRFTELGVAYHQHLHGGYGLGKSWQATFETEDRDVVSAFLTRADAEYTWTPQGGLRVVQRRPGVRQHPAGHTVWFNQADQWHPAGLPDQDLLDLVDDPADLPQWVTYGDGTPIDKSDVDAVRLAADHNRVSVEWRAGDLMVIDNMAVLHGREAFAGDRRVVVAMT